MTNMFKTTILLVLMTGLFLWVGRYLGGDQGLVIGFLFAVVTNFATYWFSDRLALAAYGARPIEEGQAPQLYRVVHDIATAAQMPMPKLYLVQSDVPNAFATGRNPNHAAVAVTEGILRLLTPEELRGVLAHELSHVRNRDTLTSAIAATFAGAIMMLSHMARFAMIFGGGRRDEREGDSGLGALVAIILAPFAAMLIQLAISRSREYEADATGARLLHDPQSLASALAKIAAASGRMEPLPAGPATAHLWIVNPLRGSWLAKLFSTHPPVEERIRRLRSMVA